MQGRRRRSTPEQQIAACTALIEAAGREGRDLALAYFRRAAAYLKHQDFDSAIRDFGEAWHRTPTTPRPGSDAALLTRAKATPNTPSTDYDAAIKLDPDNVKALSNRAAIYADQRAYERALEDNNRVVELAPDQARSYVSRGLTYARRGDFENALHDFDQAIALDAKSAIAYFNRGRVYFSKGEVERAIDDYGAGARHRAEACKRLREPRLRLSHAGPDRQGHRRLRCGLAARRQTRHRAVSGAAPPS